ncbi:MAG: hypothetical protein ACK5QT_03610 [Oligoflexia bacterium]
MRGFFGSVSLILCASFLAPALCHASGAACHQFFAGLSGQSKTHLLRSIKFSQDWARYHDLLSYPVQGQQKYARYRREMKSRAREMAEAYSVLEPDFPKDDFLRFFESELAAPASAGSQASDTTLGALMEQSYGRFIAQYKPEGIRLFEASGGIRNYLEGVLRSCGSDPSCFALEIKKLPGWMSDSLKGTCMAMSPAAVSAFIQDTVLNLTVLGAIFANQMSGKLEDFPFGFVINGTLWSAILSERNCRKAVAATHSLPFGRALSDSKVPTYGSEVWRSVKYEVADWKWYPASAATWVAISYLQDEITDKERPEGYYGWRWSFSVIYNTLSGPPRRVLVIDPLFKKAFPALGRWINERVASGKMAEIVTKVTNSGTDYGIRYQEWTFWGLLYDEYMDATAYSESSKPSK